MVHSSTLDSDAISLKNVKFTWPGQAQPVIDIESLTVASGERVFLRGPSGSGKTTLLSLIAAVIKPQAGHLYINGIDLASMRGAESDRFRALHIGIVFQQFNLLPFLSVLENVQLPCRFSADRRKRATESGCTLQQEAERLLRAMSLPASLFSSRGMQLSSGQQQRVAVARALIGQPALIIADEPTSALDVDARNAFLQLLFDEITLSKSALLFVSHDSSLAGAFDRSIDLQQINQATPHRDLKPPERQV